jgi:5'-3' exonuclease
LIPQFDYVKDISEQFGFVNIGVANYEADDVIGTLAKISQNQIVLKCLLRNRIEVSILLVAQVYFVYKKYTVIGTLAKIYSKDNEVHIVTGDRDILQCINEQVEVFLINQTSTCSLIHCKISLSPVTICTSLSFEYILASAFRILCILLINKIDLRHQKN